MGIREYISNQVNKFKRQPPPKLPGTNPVFARSDVGRGMGCRDYIHLNLDIYREHNGAWLIHEKVYQTAVYGDSPEEALRKLWRAIDSFTEVSKDKYE
jgi:hypothetical protein